MRICAPTPAGASNSVSTGKRAPRSNKTRVEPLGSPTRMVPGKMSASCTRRSECNVSAMMAAQADVLLALERGQHVLREAVVEVGAAQERIAIGAEHFERVVADAQQGDVERATAQVVDQDGLVHVAAVAVGHRSGGGLVQD